MNLDFVSYSKRNSKFWWTLSFIVLATDMLMLAVCPPLYDITFLAMATLVMAGMLLRYFFEKPYRAEEKLDGKKAD